MTAPIKDRRRSVADTQQPKEDFELRRSTDTLSGVIKRIDVVEGWAIRHENTHDATVQKVIEHFMSSENFVCIVKRLWQHDEIKAAALTAKNQIVGEIVSAIFSNKKLWAVVGIIILLVMGYDLKTIKEILKTILL